MMKQMDFLFAKLVKNSKTAIITITLQLYYGYVKYIDFCPNKYKIIVYSNYIVRKK